MANGGGNDGFTWHDADYKWTTQTVACGASQFPNLFGPHRFSYDTYKEACTVSRALLWIWIAHAGLISILVLLSTNPNFGRCRLRLQFAASIFGKCWRLPSEKIRRVFKTVLRSAKPRTDEEAAETSRQTDEEAPEGEHQADEEAFERRRQAAEGLAEEGWADEEAIEDDPEEERRADEQVVGMEDMGRGRQGQAHDPGGKPHSKRKHTVKGALPTISEEDRESGHGKDTRRNCKTSQRQD
ncbi:hypothetical protein BDY21DRAFT_340232, partial [Lineolata rhizophorae]